jgi:hypothetical protein
VIRLKREISGGFSASEVFDTTFMHCDIDKGSQEHGRPELTAHCRSPAKHRVLSTIGRSISFFGKRKIDNLDVKQRSSSNTPCTLKPVKDGLPVKTRSMCTNDYEANGNVKCPRSSSKRDYRQCIMTTKRQAHYTTCGVPLVVTKTH